MTLPPKLLIVDDGDRYAEMALHFMRGYRYATRCTLPGPCWTCPRRPGCTLTHAHDAIELDQALALHDDVDVVLLDVGRSSSSLTVGKRRRSHEPPAGVGSAMRSGILYGRLNQWSS